MSWKIFYYDEVIHDIKEAKKWYREQQLGLDRRFVSDIKFSLERVVKNPENYEVKYRNIRVAYCHTFPYSIHFYADTSSQKLVIIAIVHQYRDPNYSQKRSL